VIRFSAALVAVAIGVLIGGIATSKLLLVYIAIVVSAVALLALAIGVVVKREELFGEGQGLVPADAGAAPVLPARTGESPNQSKPVASVPPSAPFQGPAAGYGSPFDGTAFGRASFDSAVQAAPPVTAAPPSVASPAAPHGQGRDRGADPVPPWEARPARGQWSSSPLPGSAAASTVPDWMPGGRAASAPVGQAPATAPSPAMTPQPSGPLSAPVGQAPATAPSPTMSPQSSGASGAGPGPAAPAWFAPQARPADAAPSAAEAPAEPADEEDGWPARSSRPDDEAGESPDETGRSGAPADQAAEAGTAVPAPEDTGTEPGPGEPEPEPAGPDTASAELPAESVDSEPPSADAGEDPVPGDDLVAVLRGVPRYHQPDCVLIRFLPEGDVQRLPAAQAQADGCTPCAACQPVE
jgi:hypothetical protein